MLRFSLFVIFILLTGSGCISTTESPQAFTAQVQNEITDRSVIQSAKEQAARSRADFQQSQPSVLNHQHSNNHYSQPLYKESDYAPSRFVPISANPENIQSPSFADSGFQVSPVDEEVVEKSSYSRLPNIRVVGTIAVPGGAKALIQSENNDSVMRRVGEKIMHAGQSYSIKKITNSGEVIVESESAQLSSIR